MFLYVPKIRVVGDVTQFFTHVLHYGEVSVGNESANCKPTSKQMTHTSLEPSIFHGWAATNFISLGK